MAKLANATLIPGKVEFYHAPVGTTAPTDLSTSPDAAWESIGHTSIDELMAVESEGGDAETKGTAQNSTLRVRYEPRSESVTIQMQQWDDDSLKLYYGSNMTVVNTIWMTVPTTPEPMQKAFLAVFNDGTETLGIWAPKTELFRGDDFSIEDTENFASLPLRIQFMQYLDNTFAYAVKPITTA